MAQFSKGTVLKAITELASVTHLGRAAGNINLLSAFLLLKRLGMNYDSWISKSDLFNGTRTTIAEEEIFRQGAIFDSTEYIAYGGCIFFSAFSKPLENKFNTGSRYEQLVGRFKDTLDNAIADSLLDRGQNNKYRITLQAIQNMQRAYARKFSLESVICWLFRFDSFPCEFELQELKEFFTSRYFLTERETRDLFDLEKHFLIEYGEGITGGDVREALGVSRQPVSTSRPGQIAYKMAEIFGSNNVNKLRRIHMDTADLCELLKSHGQIVLTGPPGTGKTYLVDRISEHFDKVEKIQFHQSYSYQDFVIGKTIRNGNVIETRGPLLQIIQAATAQKEKTFLLVLDEINRGNTAAIFGEFLHILDRDKRISLKIDNSEEEVFLPGNLYVIGTMNSADRSIALIDYAIRRRFLFVELSPNYDLVDQHSTLLGASVLGSFLMELNSRVVERTRNPDLIFGHSYFMQAGPATIDWSLNDFMRVLLYRVRPMLKEYLSSDSESIEYILPNALCSSSTREELTLALKAYINAKN